MPGPLQFETFELVMIAVAGNGDWIHNWPRHIGLSDDAGKRSNFIVDWRVKVGRLDPEIDGRARSPVWRANWRDVREALVAINTEGDTPALGRPWPTEALCKRLVAERGIKPFKTESVAMMEPRVAGQVAWLAKGVWHQYIIDRSGKHYRLFFPGA